MPRRALRGAMLLAVLVLAAAALGAQATLSYAYGTVELVQGGAYRAVTVGSRLPAEASLRLGAGSVAEISSGDLRITLSQPGTYFLPDLVRTSRESSRWNLAAVVRNKVRALFAAPAGSGSTPMGVRAEQMADQEDFGWMDEEKEALEQGKSDLAGERYAEAARSFRQALELADSASRPAYLFYLAYALALAGEDGAAQQALGQIEDPRSLEHYAEYVLLAARLAAEGQAYARAEELLRSFLAERPAHPAAQEALLLSAYCSQRQGRGGEAAASLRRVIEIDPATDAAAAARAALDRL